jgi:hypothetical protein
LINTSDLHNQVLLNKSDWGIFATTIDNFIEDIVSQVKTAEAIPEAEYETRLKEDVMIVLDFIFNKIKAEIEEKIEQEEFARSVFRHEEKDITKAEQCKGSIMAYKNVIKLIEKYKAESEET